MLIIYLIYSAVTTCHPYAALHMASNPWCHALQVLRTFYAQKEITSKKRHARGISAHTPSTRKFASERKRRNTIRIKPGGHQKD